MLLYFIIPFAGHNFFVLFSVSFGISFEHAVQLPFTVFLYSPFPDNYAFLSLSPSQIKNIQSADTVPVHGHSPLVPTQKVLQPVTELTNRLLAIQSSLSSFASHQPVTESTDLLSGAITVLPLASIPVSEDRPADPPGDHLVRRTITKFSGQPSLPALLVTEYHRLQRIAVAEIAGYRENKLVLYSKRKGGPHSNKFSLCLVRGQPSYN